ncbi:MAG: hypothetical protein EXQ47_12240 [Bryobacterales bacterium]|nr:hypothetical protein [Bryobacterales bacterium]
MSALGPPPLPVPPISVVIRCVGAGVAGAVAYLATLFRFLTYSQRNRLSAESYVAFAVAVLVIGFLAALGAGKVRYRIAGCVPLGVFVVHAGVIAVDLQKDPTDHNLFPFEFVILGICASPAYIGAAAAGLADRLRRRT